MIGMHYSKLQIWQRSMALAKSIFRCVNKFPKHEVYGLTSQLKKAVVSVPSNIAEGSQRSTAKDFANFILMAKGSLAEVETQLILAQDLAYLSSDTLKSFLKETEEIHRMIHSFHKKLLP